LSCTNHQKHISTKANADTSLVTLKNDKNNAKYYTAKDTILIEVGNAHSLKFSKAEFNDIIDRHSEFTNDFIPEPDQAYMSNGVKGKFASEAGQDNYYILYAWFVKQKNGINKYEVRRKTLIDIYSNINSLFGSFEYGGTYFGHQYARIPGYAEYSVSLYKQSEKNLVKSYDIAKQKDLYITSLRQLIEDENSIDPETTGTDKILRKKELNEIVDKIDKAITDNFYLRRAQAFQYKYYEYY